MRLLCTLLFTCLTALTQAQLVAGPMLGQVELRTASIWLEVGPSVKEVAIRYATGKAPATIAKYQGELGREFNPVRVDLGGLEPNTTYTYTPVLDGKPQPGGSFTTKDLWQWRKPAPDFSFLTGSCNYVNQPPYDRPGRPYGGDSSIFGTMAREKAGFMLWLGDNWYTREVDYHSPWGLWARASNDRKQAVLQPLLQAMPHYAIWDDHDYGPNDIGGHYILKEEAREVFNRYWANPSSGHNGQGIYTHFSWSDADFFLLDDRWWRAADALPDSVGGQPNPAKIMLGRQQLDWLKNALLYSNATFKFIAVGSQVLNPVSPFDKFANFKAEYNELMTFLSTHKVKGVIFMTGDRHHSEIIRVERPGTYPLYDITVSPLTSGTHEFGGPEANNPYRIVGVDQLQNYGRFSISGPKGERSLRVDFLDVRGKALASWQVSEKDLQ